MEKVYDKLDWSFVTCVLRKFGFSDQWIVWINELIKDGPISLLIGGASTAFFKSSRGLTQGDPLSPSLFIIVEEVLSRGISQLLKTNKIKPFYIHKQAPPISHALFADDTVIFMNARKESIINLYEFLEEYESCSGQKVNVSKSSFYTSQKTSEIKLARIENIIGWKKGSFPFTYLGGLIY